MRKAVAFLRRSRDRVRLRLWHGQALPGIRCCDNRQPLPPGWESALPRCAPGRCPQAGELAITDPKGFKKLVDLAKKNLNG